MTCASWELCLRGAKPKEVQIQTKKCPNSGSCRSRVPYQISQQWYVCPPPFQNKRPKQRQLPLQNPKIIHRHPVGECQYPLIEQNKTAVVTATESKDSPYTPRGGMSLKTKQRQLPLQNPKIIHLHPMEECLLSSCTAKQNSGSCRYRIPR